MLTSRLRDPGFQRVLFRRINVVMLLAWRLGFGRVITAAPAISGRVMVLATTGRRWGRIRRFPITYAPCDGGMHCVAGFGKSTSWYRNALAHPEVELWLPDGSFSGRAEPLDAGEHLDVVRDVFVASAFALGVRGGRRERGRRRRAARARGAVPAGADHDHRPGLRPPRR